MDVSWGTVICSVTGSIVASGIFSGVFSGVVAKIIQCAFDKRLMEQKKDIQKILDEHQIRFKYWHKEKLKAIKELYSDSSILHYLLNSLHSLEEKDTGETDKYLIERERKDLLDKLNSSLEKPVEDWFRNRIFLDEKDDENFVNFAVKANRWLIILVDSDVEKRNMFIKENGKIIQEELKSIMDNLRKSFRSSLLDAETKAVPSNSFLNNCKYFKDEVK